MSRTVAGAHRSTAASKILVVEGIVYLARPPASLVLPEMQVRLARARRQPFYPSQFFGATPAPVGGAA